MSEAIILAMIAVFGSVLGQLLISWRQLRLIREAKILSMRTNLLNSDSMATLMNVAVTNKKVAGTLHKSNTGLIELAMKISELNEKLDQLFMEERKTSLRKLTEIVEKNSKDNDELRVLIATLTEKISSL